MLTTPMAISDRIISETAIKVNDDLNGETPFQTMELLPSAIREEWAAKVNKLLLQKLVNKLLLQKHAEPVVYCVPQSSNVILPNLFDDNGRRIIILSDKKSDSERDARNS